MEERITVHEKARGETINVYIGEYRGTKYLHIREWYLDKDQEEKPTKKGVALPVEKCEALKDAISQIGPSDGSLDERVTVHEKARGESINVYVGEYRGTRYLHIREWYLDKDQEEKPTKKGVAIPMEKVDALTDAIDQLVPAEKAEKAEKSEKKKK
ncbi:MAG: transcriptional coactivator p15/PC4 family protein [Candidatus Obscuribacterales bacterium]|nr:transcriptional coactivator p15/PC4 family protein [Candidatus Obscuribacterales bacterium]